MSAYSKDQQGLVDIGAVQETTRTMRPAHFLLTHTIHDSPGGFFLLFFQSCMGEM